MRLSPALLTAAILAVFSLQSTQAQPLRGPIQGPEAPEAPPGFEMNEAGARRQIDFSLGLRPVSPVGLSFTQFGKKKLLIFYFSATCSHCQHAAPYVMKLSEQLKAEGVNTIAISIKNNTDDDIRAFMASYNVSVPVFSDETRSFGETYGTGSIPLLLLVNEKGEYIRHKTFAEDITPNLIKTEVTQFAKK